MPSLLKLLTHDLVALIYIILKNSLGTITHPYLTWKKLTREQQLLPAFVLLSLLSAYFIIRVPLQIGLNINYLTWITRSLISIIIAFGSYLLTTSTIWFVAQQLKPQPDTFKKILACWIYSYLPTIIWFSITAISFILIPPPRQATFQGISFSVLYTAFSIALLSWKALLYILTLRIACHLNLKQALIASIFILPILATYSYVLLNANIWRVPFI